MSDRSILDDFPGRESMVAAVATQMRLYALTPEQVLAEYRVWATEQRRRGARPVAARRPSRGETTTAQLAHACPRCGGAVEMQRLCPRVSPRWRVQLACMRDDCDWHGLSAQPVAALLSGGPAAIQQYVEEG